MSLEKNSVIGRRDYLLISFIGISFALFSFPILKNASISFIKINTLTEIFLILFFIVLSNIGLWISSLIAKKIPIFLQLAKFGAVGAFNTFLDWGAVSLLIIATGITKGISYSIFVGIGFIVANIGSYFWNKYWTFSSKEGSLAQFFIVSLIGFGVKVLVASLIVNVIGALGGYSESQWAIIGNAAGTIFFMIWNFIGYKLWVFKK